jgi:hypothetical protein
MDDNWAFIANDEEDGGIAFRAFPLPIDAGEGEQRSGFVTLERETVPARGLALIRLAEGGRRHEAAALLETVLPELHHYLVVAGVGDALGRVAVPEEDEPPAAQYKLAFAVGALLDDGRHVPGKDRRSWSNAAMRLSERKNFRASAARLVLIE